MIRNTHGKLSLQRKFMVKFLSNFQVQRHDNTHLMTLFSQLIRQGAGILISPEEFLSDLPYKLQKLLIKFSEKSNENEIMLESPEKLLYSVLSLEPKNIQKIEEELSLTRGEIMEGLLNLEMNGWIQEVSKNDYIRLK